VQRTLKTVGRVVADENRVFPVVAGCEGWITRLEPGTATGDRVRKGQPLAVVSGREYTTAERSFLYALKTAENPPPALPGDEGAPALTLLEARRFLARVHPRAFELFPLAAQIDKCLGDSCGTIVETGELIEDWQVRERFEQRLMLVLAVQFDQPRRQIAKGRSRGQRAVDEGAAPALARDLPADDQLAVGVLEDRLDGRL